MTETDLQTVLRNQQRAAAPLSAPVQPAKPHAPRTGYRSKTEASYAQHLALAASAGVVLSWHYEPITLKLAPGVKYQPDFLMIGHPGKHQLVFIEIKGRKGAGYYSKPLSQAKIRIAAEMFPFWRFSIVWPGERLGTWDSMVVGGEK